MFGILHLFCPICGKPFVYGKMPSGTMFHREFGRICSKACFEAAELKYARHILGKDDEPWADRAPVSSSTTATTGSGT
jgi:hypothetical protein